MMYRLPLLSRPFALALLVLLALVAASPLLAAPRLVSVRAAVQGELIEAKGTDKKAEIVTFDEDLATVLLGVRTDETVQVSDWPVTPDRRAEVRLTRHEVYAPDAKIYVVEGRGNREVPRSRRVYFWGHAEGDKDTQVLVSVDPSDHAFRGFSLTREGIHELRPMDGRISGARQHLVAPADIFLNDDAAQAVETHWSCGEVERQNALFETGTAPAASTPESADPLWAAAISSLHTATIAVDTDNEFMSQKAGNNQTSATNYIADLFAAMNVIYERDLLVRLVQGTTYLRVTPDPYSAPPNAVNPDGSGGGANSGQLSEFANHWSSTYGGVSRALAMMLSGKQPQADRASGIARLNGLCSTSNGYSFSQVFKFVGSTAANDVLVIAHEIGHNFGSDHSHCYSPPIDNCFSGEAFRGCYSGTPSCPAPQTINGVTNVTGTLMSYCHVSGLSGCSSSRVFHPRTVDLLDDIIQSKVNTCIFPVPTAPPPPTLASVSPASGPTAGGKTVTLMGTNFQSGATVTFGGTAATSVVVASPTKITAVIPAKAAGKVAVVVTNPDTNAATLNPGFFYAAAPAATDFYTVSPCRVVDTTDPAGPLGGPALAAGQTRVFDLTGPCGVPPGAKSLALNITVLNPTEQGNLQFFPGNAMPLGTSSINFADGLNRANNAVLLLATDGTGTLGVKNGSSGVTGLLIDVVGYFQ